MNQSLADAYRGNLLVHLVERLQLDAIKLPAFGSNLSGVAPMKPYIGVRSGILLNSHGLKKNGVLFLLDTYYLLTYISFSEESPDSELGVSLTTSPYSSSTPPSAGGEATSCRLNDRQTVITDTREAYHGMVQAHSYSPGGSNTGSPSSPAPSGASGGGYEGHMTSSVSPRIEHG